MDKIIGMPSRFDRLMGQLDGLPDVTKTREATITSVNPLGVGGITTTIIQTYRHRELGDYIFVQTVSDERPIRMVIEPAGAAAIARQRGTVTKIIQRNHGKRIAAERKAAGLQPGFMGNPGKGWATEEEGQGEVMPYRIFAFGVANGPDDIRAWVEAYDPDAAGGRGHIGFTRIKDKALTFPSVRDAMDFYTQVSKVLPVRDDGKPNRPLTAYNLVIEPLAGRP